MDNFTYCTPTRYVFGRGAELKAGEMAAEQGWKRVMVVFGQGSVVRSGLLERVEQSLKQYDIEIVELGGAQPNPVDTLVYEGIALGRRLNIDGIIGVGGGSAIDTAKAIAIGIPYEGDFWDFYCGKQPPLVAVPVATVLTIPAAGSEGSGNSVITRTDGLIKLSLRTECLRPVFSLMNPELTFTLPAFQSACGICDMMAHIFERYFSPTSEVEVTDRVAEGLLMAIIEEAPKVMADPTDYQARANIMWSGTLAHNGLCGTGRVEDWVCHFMEHEISAIYGVAHGAGLAVMIPAWMRFMAEHQPQKPAQLGRRIFGLTINDPKECALLTAQHLDDFYRSLGLPTTFAALGIENPDIDLMVKKLHANKGELIGGYRRLDKTDTEQIYRLAL